MSLKYFLLIILSFILIQNIKCSVEEERLLKNLFKGYNKLIRPVKNSSEHVVITMDLVLLQLINVYEKEQIMKTNVWINLKWRDFQLDWSAADYKVGSVRVPHDKVWTPDIVLFNNADGNYEASYKPNVVLYADVDENSPNILWVPPSIYKSSCTIDVRYFPFDEQLCEMRFGSWTFDAQQVKLKREKPMVNLEDYLPSGTWDVIGAPGHETYSNETNRMELVYHFRIRRKTLFYTVNLIIPTVLISFLSIFVFYLPTDEGEKMTLCISILLALVVFLLLVSKILPPTSMVIPLISKYLIFTLMMNIITIFNTVIIINWNYRTPRTHTMPKWVRFIFIEFFPIILFMKRPGEEPKSLSPKSKTTTSNNKLDQITQTSPSRLNNFFNNNINNNNNNNNVNDNNEIKELLTKSNKNRLNKNLSLELADDNINNSFDFVGATSNTSTLNKSKKSSTETMDKLMCSNLNQESDLINNDSFNLPIKLENNNNNKVYVNNSYRPGVNINNTLARPKQQQHKHLDKMAKRAQSHHNQSFNFNSNKLYQSLSRSPKQIPIHKQTDDLVNTSYSIRYDSSTYNSNSNLNNHQHQNQNTNKSQRLQYMTIQNRSLSRESNNQCSLERQYPSNTNKLVNRSSRHRKRQQYIYAHSRSLEHSTYNNSNYISKNLNDSFDNASNNVEESKDNYESDNDNRPVEFSAEIIEAADKVTYITNHIKSENDYEEMRDDWKYVALVIDRLQLYIFFSVTVIGTALILFDAPHIFEFVDQQEKLKKLIAENKF